MCVGALAALALAPCFAEAHSYGGWGGHWGRPTGHEQFLRPAAAPQWRAPRARQAPPQYARVGDAVEESPEAYTITVAPVMSPAHARVELDGGLLTIVASAYGGFEKRYRVPTDVDATRITRAFDTPRRALVVRLPKARAAGAPLPTAPPAAATEAAANPHVAAPPAAATEAAASPHVAASRRASTPVFGGAGSGAGGWRSHSSGAAATAAATAAGWCARDCGGEELVPADVPWAEAVRKDAYAVDGYDFRGEHVLY